jgi:hypothetical protein
MEEEPRREIGRSLEERFATLMGKLKVQGTAGVVSRFIRPPAVPLRTEAEIAAAGGIISAAEKKAEGLAD